MERPEQAKPAKSDLEALTRFYKQRNLPAFTRQAGLLAKRFPHDASLLRTLGAAHAGFGHVMAQHGQMADAVASYRQALTYHPDDVGALTNLGNLLRAQGDLEAAIASHRKAIRINSAFFGAHDNLGVALQEVGDLDAAIASHRQAIALKPDHAAGHLNLGNALRTVGKTDEAIARYRQAITIDPNRADAHINLGTTLRELGRLDDAAEVFRNALRVDPKNAEAQSYLIFQQATMCDWSEGPSPNLKQLGISTAPVRPWRLLSTEDAPERHLLRSLHYAKRQWGRIAAQPLERPVEIPSKLRLGYFSADFHNHATMHLMAGLLELHDPDRFDVFLYSYGDDQRDGMRARLEASGTNFRSVHNRIDRDIADRGRQDNLHIAIDLKGYTHQGRPGIFAHRAAPLQMSWLGYPGTSGCDFMDYIIADPVVIPDVAQSYYSEKVLYLPETYQPNDHRREIADRQFARTELGLPESGFVFCCFNNSYKITSREFDIWMRLLGSVQGSVLWLLETNQWAETNLRNEARARGIDADRLVFAELMPPHEHLARHRCADLFLDTFNVNAHTTASDALWAGLPVLTKLGSGFAARVAGSLLNAVGLEELATVSEEDYEALALQLATHPAKLKSITRQLEINRLTTPLFASENFTRHLETAYQMAFDRYLAGEPPVTITVPKSD